MFLENLKKFLTYYGKGRYFKLAGFAFLSFCAGALEFIGIALIYPFVLLIIQPDVVTFSKYLKFENSMASGLLIGLSVLLIFIFKNAFIIFTQYVQYKFTSNWKQEIVANFMKFYIYAPYRTTMHISVNDKLYAMGTLCDQTIDCFILRVLNLLTNIVIIFMVIALLLLKFPVPALITIVFVCVSIIIQNKYFKARTAAVASVMAEKFKNYQTVLLENINNIKEIKILSSENVFYENFVQNLSEMRTVQARLGFYASVPPYIVEILVVSALLLMACILSIQNINSNSNLIASFAIIVAALFRIAPALNRIQSAVIAINTSRNFVRQINELYEKFDFNIKLPAKDTKKMSFNDKIVFENVKFSYNQEKEVIKNVSFEIKKGDFVGIIGLSGAGKSTIADIFTGLLPINSGKILVDGYELTENLFPQFRKLIGYVPQQINVLDKSFKDNVVWGCEHVDEARVIKALQEAQIYDVIKDYPNGINSNIIVGSNGLSQGQKQRLAIARALYNNHEILILDEATSALDVQVENLITETLKEIGKTKTIIAIAHRLSTLKACNKLIYLKDGQIVDVGTFEELCSRYVDFDNLVKLSKIN